MVLNFCRPKYAHENVTRFDWHLNPCLKSGESQISQLPPALQLRQLFEKSAKFLLILPWRQNQKNLNLEDTYIKLKIKY